MKLAIVTPIHDKVAAHTFVSMSGFCAAAAGKGYELKMNPLVQLAILPHGRNVLLQEAYDWGADVVLSVDDDMIFMPDDAFKLISYVTDSNVVDDMRDQDVVSGVYKYKNEKNVTVGHALKDGETRGELMEMDLVGMGFAAISRRCLDEMMKSSEKYFDETTGVDVHCLYEMRLAPLDSRRRRIFHGEDRVFCDRWRALGGRIWLATDVVVGHVGYKVYR